MFEIKNDLGRRLFCGPSAICLLTGTPASRVEQMLRRARNDWCRKKYGKRYYADHKHRQFKGTYNIEIKTVLERLGCRVTQEKVPEAWSSIQSMASDTGHMDRTFLIEVPRHYMVMEKGLIADSSQKTPGPYLRRRRVDKVWTIEAPAVPRHTTGVARRERAPLKPKPDVKTQRAGKLQEQIKRWESKLKRAQTALKKLRPKLKRYEKLGVIA